MAVSLDQHPSTARVTLPRVYVGTLQQLTDLAVAQEPSAEKRIRRGAGMLASTPIYETDECGVFLVQSCEPGRFYRTTSSTCTCPDATNRNVRCKHSWALTMLIALCAESRYQILQAHFERQRAGVA